MTFDFFKQKKHNIIIIKDIQSFLLFKMLIISYIIYLKLILVLKN